MEENLPAEINDDKNPSHVMTTLDDHIKKCGYKNGDVQPVMKKGCKLCNSPFRAAAEMKYEETKQNISAVHRFLKDECGEDMSYFAVKRHIENHGALVLILI